MKRTKRNAPAITPGEALEILASAVNYCQQAGLLVRAGNAESSLVLAIDGAHVRREGDAVAFLPGTASTSTPGTSTALDASTSTPGTSTPAS